ncbi:hypothetical protein MPEAHAMD_4843 [Methylobacterium frigidaeris]|uniref:Uncharacterized protein n=1 Tax=Methylobacterium frigidaeris TaxID=2038277 RepID=A0AA37M6C2_9HYPH|nr:hypothetical protein MPEAHAMD_4843 [Methylobacterium frigidaeris]
MTENAIVEQRQPRWRRLLLSGPKCPGLVLARAGRLGSRRRTPAGATSPSDVAGRPPPYGLGRWLLDAVVIGFARSACLHTVHADYADFLRGLDGRHPL